MPITKLALQRRNIVELNLIKHYVDKYTKLWSKMRQKVRITEIVPFGETKLWNSFSVKCNYVDEFLLTTLEGQGYTIAEVRWLGYDNGESKFDLRVLKTDTTTDTKRMEACLNSPEETRRIEKLCSKPGPF